MILTIDYTNNNFDFAGNDYYFGDFSQGMLPFIQSPTENRLYFSADTEAECVQAAFDYVDSMEISCSRAKLRLVLLGIKL